MLNGYLREFWAEDLVHTSSAGEPVPLPGVIRRLAHLRLGAPAARSSGFRAT